MVCMSLSRYIPYWKDIMKNKIVGLEIHAVEPVPYVEAFDFEDSVSRFGLKLVLALIIGIVIVQIFIL